MADRGGPELIVRRFEDLEEYLPAGHAAVVNRLLAGASLGDGADVSIWHGCLEPGGRSELHSHDNSLQIYVGLAGEMMVGDGVNESSLGPLATAVIRRGERHFIENRSDEPAEVLVISVPALR